MSLSDYSISSPRKGNRNDAGDKSITYDEEFEKFLNDTSESDLLSNRYKKPVTSKAWWDNEEDVPARSFSKQEPGKSASGASKSFLKQSKPAPSARLATPLESDEFDHQADEFRYGKPATVRFEDLDVDNIPRLSLDNSSVSSYQANKELRTRAFQETNEGIREVEEDESSNPRSSSRRSQLSQSNMRPASSQNDDYYEDFDKEDSSNNSPNSTSKTPDLRENLVEQAAASAANNNNNAATDASNLLSKVMFMDSLENAGSTGPGLSTLKHQQATAGVVNRPSTIVSADEMAGDVFQSPQHLADQSGTRATLHDLADMEKFYRNFANTDSGLNTLIKANYTVSTVNEAGGSQPSVEPRFPAAASSVQSAGSLVDSAFGLQAIHAIRSELEKRELENVLSLIERQMPAVVAAASSRKGPTSAGKAAERPKSAVWPSDKFKNVRSSGYGRGWSPQQVVKRSADSSSKRTSPGPRTTPQPRQPRKSVNSTSPPNTSASRLLNQSDSSPLRRSFDGEKFYKEEIHNLRSQMINQANKYERDVKDLHADYEKQILELRTKIGELTAKINIDAENEKNLREILRREPSEDETDRSKRDAKSNKNKQSVLEKNLKEQDDLIKGYQLENERLYSELKGQREAARNKQQQLEEELQKLKCELIQEKLSRSDKVVARSLQEPPPPPPSLPVEQQPSRLMPTQEETRLEGKTASGYEEELRRVRFELNDANERVRLLAGNNTELKKRLEYYEKNQQQIELDVKIIDAKNREIKRLGDRLKALESGRTPPDCLRQIKQLSNQLREMDTLLKRYKKPVENGAKAASAINVANMTLGYYEERIDRLEEQLKEKTQDLERFGRMWEQKNSLCKEVYDEHIRKLYSQMGDERPTREHDAANGSVVRRSLSLKRIDGFELDKKLAEIEAKYMTRCEELEGTNRNLRKLIDEFELRVAEREFEIERMKLDYGALVADLASENESRAVELKKRSRVSFGQSAAKTRKAAEYEPSLFRASSSENLRSARSRSREDRSGGGGSEALREAQNECARLTAKIASLQYDAKLRDQEHQASRQKARQAFESKLSALGQKHRHEMEVLVKTLTGTSGLMLDENLDFTSEWDSPLKDPMRMKCLFKARDNFEQLKQTIAAQKQTIRELSERSGQQAAWKSRLAQLEDQTQRQSEEIERLRTQLDLRKAHLSPSALEFDALNEKLRLMEQKMQRRERDLGQMLGGGGSLSSSLLSRSSGSLNVLSNNEASSASGLVRHYEEQLALKNQEIEKFRAELDSMLQLLQTLQVSSFA